MIVFIYKWYKNGVSDLVAVARDVLAVAVPARPRVRLWCHRVLDTVLSEGRALREHVFVL